MRTRVQQQCPCSNFHRLLTSSIFSVVVIAAGFVNPAGAADEELSKELPPVVISATKMEQPVEAATSSVTVITAKEIEERQITTVADALRIVVSVDVVRSGGPGSITSVFLRGANSQHTLVMIDGIQVNSPANGGFDFANLTTHNIERIEIVRGAQSTLYGSDAIGGIINIITKKGEGEPSVTVSAEGGRYDTAIGSVGVSGQSGPVDYSVSLSHERTEGFSRAASGTEADSYLNTTLSTKLGFEVFGDGRLELVSRYIWGQSELDGIDPVLFVLADDLSAKQRTQTSVTSLSLHKPLTAWWSQRLTASVNLEQVLHNQFGEFDTRSQRVDWQHDLSVNEWWLLTLGAEYEGQKGENSGAPSHTLNNAGFYAQGQLQLPLGLTHVVGVRYDNNNRYGNIFTYKAEIAYLLTLTLTKFRAGLGTGFRGPTIADLFFPGFGNPTLEPETSETVEAGIEQSFLEKRLVISVTHFRTNFDNLIQFVFDPTICVAPFAPTGFCPQNVATARSEGQEIVVIIQPILQASMRASYTHTTAKNRTTGLLLLRRPRGKAYVGVTIVPIKPLTITTDVNYVSRRNDIGGQTGSYWVARVAGNYAVTKNIQVYGRIENLTNKKYQEVLGFNTAGLSIFGGVRATFQ